MNREVATRGGVLSAHATVMVMVMACLNKSTGGRGWYSARRRRSPSVLDSSVVTTTLYGVLAQSSQMQCSVLRLYTNAGTRLKCLGGEGVARPRSTE